MSTKNKLAWLKRILVIKIAFGFLFWGLPCLLLPVSFLQRSGVSVAGDTLYLRLLGAVILALAVAYWYAWKDPAHNVAIIKAGVVDNGLCTLVALYFIVFHGLRNITMLISAVLTLFFFITFILLMPKPETA
jgi:hypothetical protein